MDELYPRDECCWMIKVKENKDCEWFSLSTCCDFHCFCSFWVHFSPFRVHSFPFQDRFCQFRVRSSLLRVRSGAILVYFGPFWFIPVHLNSISVHFGRFQVRSGHFWSPFWSFPVNVWVRFTPFRSLFEFISVRFGVFMYRVFGTVTDLQ